MDSQQIRRIFKVQIGERIQKYRKEAGMSQEQLGEKLGVSRQAVSKWETGESLPELDKIIQMAELFGVTTDELLRKTASTEKVETESRERQNRAVGPKQAFQDADGFGNGPLAPLFRFAKRKGYLAGYYYMGIGALMGVILLGFWFAANSMMGGFFSFGSNFGMPFGNALSSPLKIFVVVGMVIAACVFIFGAVIAIKLKKYKK
jgi:transcriptional regulator with XRE-family HTH domain